MQGAVSFVGREKKIAIVQSNYIPWKGYFDLMNSVDEFILYDDAQYTKRDWRNRNIIKSPNGPLWLTIPVEVKGRYDQKIKDTKVADPLWGKSHWKSISASYRKAQNFDEVANTLAPFYQNTAEQFLSEVNFSLISKINLLLGITTKISWSMDYGLIGENPTERLLRLCQSANATKYISGPLAKDYLDVAMFQQAGIAVSFFNYDNYPVYNQLHPPFDHRVSIVDLLCNELSSAQRLLKTFPESLAEALPDKCPVATS